jgi:hypothetical protein
MYNGLDDAFIEHQKNEKAKDAFIKKEADNLKQRELKRRDDLLFIQDTLLQDIERYIKYISSIQNDTMLILSVGPIYNFDSNRLGTALDIGFLKGFNIWNLYWGVNLNTATYYPATNNLIPDIGLSFYIGKFFN